MADSSKKKWFPWRRRSQAPQTPRPESREVAAAQVTDKYSEYPSDGLTPVRLAEIFKEADAGDVLRQAELFEEMEEKDPHLFSQLQTRKNAVTGLDYEVIPFDSDDPRDKEIAEFVEAQLGGIEGFEDIMLDLLDAIGKGFAVSEIMWSYDEGHVVVDDIRSRHQKRFFWDSVDDSFKVRTQEAPEGIELPKNKFIVHKYKARSGHPSRAGVLRVVAWMYLFKNYTLKDWVAFCEVFGMPLRLGKYQPGASEDDKRALMQALVAIGADAAGIFPDGTAIEFVNTEKTSSTDLYERLARYGKKRKKAQKTQGLVTLSRTNDQGEAVKIPKGHVFKTEKDVNGEELRFFVLEAAVLQKGARSVDVLVEAEKEGSRYNVPEAQITRSLTFLNGIDGISNGEDWIVREGSDTEDDESLRTRGLRSWSELAARSIEDTFINTAEAVPGVLFAQADCDHPRGQGTVDVIVTGTAGEATEGLLKEVREAADKIAGPYDNVIVKSSVTAPQDIEVTVTTADVAAEEEVENRVNAILADLLAVRKGRRFNELRRSDINFAIRSNYSAATNTEITIPAEDVVLDKDKVITLGTVKVAVRRE